MDFYKVLKQTDRDSIRKLLRHNVSIYNYNDLQSPVITGVFDDLEIEQICEWKDSQESTIPECLKQYNGMILEFKNRDYIYRTSIGNSEEQYKIYSEFISKVKDKIQNFIYIYLTEASGETTYELFRDMLDFDSKTYNELIQISAEYGKGIDIANVQIEDPEAEAFLNRDPLLKRLWVAFIQIYQDLKNNG